MALWRALGFSILVGVTACSGSERADDPPDVTAARDGGFVDGGFVDAGPRDAGRDGGTRDAGPDAGFEPDGGFRDAGPMAPVCEPVAPRRVVTVAAVGCEGIVPVSDGYLVAHRVRSNGTLNHSMMKLDTGGARVGASQRFGTDADQWPADMIADGDGAVYVHSEAGVGLRFVHFGRDGLPTGSSPMVGPHGEPTIAKTDTGFGLVYSVLSGETAQLWFRRLGPNGQPTSFAAVPLTDGTTFDASPDLAWNGTHFGLAFHRGYGDEARAAFWLLDADGVPLTATPTIADDVQAYGPVVVSNGDGFLMMSSFYPDGYARLFDASGSPVQSRYVAGDMNAATAEGQTYTMAFTNNLNPLSISTLTPGSAPVVQVQSLATGGALSLVPQIAWDGSGYAVLFGRSDTGVRWFEFARVCP